jgi:nicotinamidase-related amidase
MTDGFAQAAAVYDAAEMGGALRRGSRPAVLVVDFSRGFTDPACALGSDLTGPVMATRLLLDLARATDVPVIFTAVGFQPESDRSLPWLQKLPGLAELAIGTRWVEIDPRLGRRPSEPVIVKQGASAFFGTPLAPLLVSLAVDTVVLCGATTSGCVRATAVDLMQFGWTAVVPRDCVGDRARAPHEANLFDIQAKYGDVVSADAALAYLRTAGAHAPAV